MALPNTTLQITRNPSAKAKQIGQLFIGMLSPLATKIQAIHRGEMIYIIYRSDDHDAFSDRVEALLENGLISQRLKRDEIEPEDAYYLTHIASGLPVTLQAAI